MSNLSPSKEIIPEAETNAILEFVKLTVEDVSSEMIPKHCYTMGDFSTRVWEDIISVSCPEEFRYFVNVLQYAKAELWERGEVDAFYLKEEDGKFTCKVFDKFDWRKCWTDWEYDPAQDNVWVVDYTAIEEEIREKNRKYEEEKEKILTEMEELKKKAVVWKSLDDVISDEWKQTFEEKYNDECRESEFRYT